MSLYAQGVIRVLTDPDAKYFESGKSVVKFFGGISEGKDKEGNYINNAIEVEAWGQDGEIIVNYAPKGSSVLVSGRLRQDEWTDKASGELRRRHVLTANRIELLPKSGDGTAAAPATAAPAAPAPAATGEFIPF
jgi:single-strand DNA-binding protein